ncbi:MAG: cytochrome c, partial [Epsilonproteobacteria bacterium]
MKKKKFFLIGMTSVILLSPSALLQAQSSPDKAKQCFACHGVNGISLNPE